MALQVKRDGQWLRFTYRQLQTISLKIATFLLQQGLQKSDRVGIILENRPEWPMIYLGITLSGLTAVPCDGQLSPQELKNLILDSGAKFIFCSFSIFKAKFKDNFAESPVKFVLLDNPSLKHPSIFDFAQLEGIPHQPNLLPPVNPKDIASLIYTSGTTAQPKGVLLSHRNICANFLSIQKLKVCSASDNLLAVLPLHHTYAFMVTLIVPLFSGARITYISTLKPQELIQAIKETRVTFLAAVPQIFYLLHKSVFEKIKKVPFILRLAFWPLIKLAVKQKLGPSLKLMISGGARLEPKIARDLTALGFKLTEGYGLTETSPVVTLNPLKKVKIGSVGKPLPDVRIKIHNPDKSSIGEVLIQGPNVMEGYFKQPQATAAVIKEGWFYSGDLGYIDKDGYLFLVGREKDVIVLSSGKNIYPEELEEHYSKSPYIKEICILAQRQESFGHWLESLYAVVVADLEYFKQQNETDIRGKVRWELENLGKGLPSYQHIMGFTITKEELPRTALKKIKRYQVKERYLEKKIPSAEPKEALATEELEGLDKETSQKVVDYIARELNRRVRLDEHLEIDLGIDSLSRVEFGLGLEALFKTRIPDEKLYSLATVRDVIVALQNLKEQAQDEIQGGEEEKSWGQILSALPEEEFLKKMRLEFGLLDKLLALMAKGILLVLFKIFWRLRIQGRENFPAKGPYLICPNHASYLDGFVVFLALPLKCSLQTFFLGYSKILEHPSIHWANKSARLVSIDPNVHLTEAMQAVSFAIKHKKIFCIFPEGRRSIDEKIGDFKKGVGILIKELDVPVVPVYIQGSHHSWPRGSRFPRPYPLKIIIGKPLLAGELLERKKEVLDKYEATSQALRQEVLRLAG